MLSKNAGPADDENLPSNLIASLPEPENKRFYPALNGLRGFAVLLVFFEHYFPWAPVWMQWGWTGVDFFFVLSGFLITGILYDTRHAENRFRNFYVRRTLRIFPLYYAILILVAISIPIFHWIWKPQWFLWPIYLGNFGIFRATRDSMTLLNSGVFPGFRLHFGHFWTLCVEEQFYLVWPMAVYLIRDRIRLRNLCLAIICAAPLLRTVCYFALPRTLLQMDFLYVFTPLRVDALLIGGLIALCLRGPERARIVRLAHPLFWSLLVAIALGQTASLVFRGHLLASNFHAPGIETFGYSFIDVFAATVILLALDEKTFLFRLFNRVWLRRLGEISYGFYIFHQLFYDVYFLIPKLIFGNNVAHIDLLHALTSLICTPIIAYVSYRLFESKFLVLKNRFAV
jgi:peptidoglycan/LPS O-acetylase OafA/YrhL